MLSTGGVLRVVLVKPSKYAINGVLERFRRGCTPNTTLPYIASLTPAEVAGRRIELHAIDEYIEADLDYLRLLERDPNCTTLVAMVGVQSHQFHRALDLAAYAHEHGVANVIIGGAHVMTCDTSMMHGCGVSFALAEAELIWLPILEDAAAGELRQVYGQDQALQKVLDPPPLIPPSKRTLRRFFVPMMGIYPARGCPYRCNFCSVIQIAGRQVRSQPIETTLKTLRAAKAAGVSMIMFTSDNLNKYPEVEPMLQAMIDEDFGFRLFSQCDTQIVRQPSFVELYGRAGGAQILLGVESLNRESLLAAKKNQNHPERYREIVELCHAHGVGTHFTNIIGFPNDTEESVHEHVRVIRELGTDVATFYILTPLPGTEQYDDFMAAGMVTETNLDRFDTFYSTWPHPRFSAERLRDLLFECYAEFYKDIDVSPQLIFDMGRALMRGKSFRWDSRLAGRDIYAFMSHVAVPMRQHPLAGGFFPVTCDSAADYLELRRRVYGFELAPLPRSRRAEATAVRAA